MTLSLQNLFNYLIINVKNRRSVPRLDLSRYSEHDLRDINLPPNYRHRASLSHELDDWRARILR